jgi:hypothetical protein
MTPTPEPAAASDVHTARIPRHPDDIDLTWEQAGDALRALEGSHVAVRVVERSDPEVLLAAFTGTLGALDHAKDPAWFWPVCLAGEHEPAAAQDAAVPFARDRNHREDMGFYLRHDRFQGAVGRAGFTVLAIIQGPVLINIRGS